LTRPVDSGKASNYLKKAESSLRMAGVALEEKAYDNAVMSAVHSAINALDALAARYLSKRASGPHVDTLFLVKGLLSAQDYKDIERQFTSLMSMKNASEYEPVLMSKEDAEKAVKWCERILVRVKEKLEKA
jgi:HEPN domain-containing protein